MSSTEYNETRIKQIKEQVKELNRIKRIYEHVETLKTETGDFIAYYEDSNTITIPIKGWTISEYEEKMIMEDWTDSKVLNIYNRRKSLREFCHKNKVNCIEIGINTYNGGDEE